LSIKNLLDLLKQRLPLFIRSKIDRLETSPLGRRLAHGAFWSLLGTLASRGLNMAAMIVLARILGKNEFGEIGIIQNSVLMFQTLAGFGLGWAATRYVARFKNSDAAKTGRIISFVNLAAVGTGGLSCVVFFISAPWLATHPLGAPHLVHALQISSLSLLVASLAGAQNGALAGFEAFRSIARINCISGIINFLAIIGGGILSGVEGAVWGILIGQIANWSMNYFNMRLVAGKRGISLSLRGCLQEREVLWQFGLPALLGGSAFQAATWAASVLLVNQPNGYAEMGIYNAANQWFSILLFLPMILGQSAIPVFSEYIAVGKVEKIRSIFKASLRFNISVVFTIVIVGSLSSRWIMGLYGSDFKDAWMILVLTFFAAGIAAIQAPAAQIISASGRMWLGLIMAISWAIIFIFSSYFLIEWRSGGIATARIFAYVAYLFWSFRLSNLILRKLEDQ
jgi:O-antigen/teichoic acid export membrane protein